MATLTLSREETRLLSRAEILGNLSTGRFWGDGDVYKRASLGKRAPSFPPKSNLKQRGVFATATLSKTALKACENLCEKCLFVNQERCCYLHMIVK